MTIEAPPPLQTARIAGLAIGLLAVLGAILVGIATRYGVGLRDDSFAYLTGAETLAHSGRYGRISGEGEFKPNTNFPPLYSVSLAAVDTFTHDLPLASRLLNQGLFGGLVLAAGWGIYRATRSPTASVMAAALVLTSDVLLSLSTWALSEPLFLLLLGLGLFFLSRFLATPDRGAPLGAASIFLGLAALTRYAALPFLGVALVAIGFRGPRKGRAKNTAMFLAIAVVPLLAFVYRNWELTGNALNRPQPYWHAPPALRVDAGSSLILGWFLPERVVAGLPGPLPSILLLAAAGGFGCMLLRGMRQERARGQGQAPQNVLLALLAASVIAYGVFLLASLSFLDALTPINDRILSPFLLLAFLSLILMGHRIHLRSGRMAQMLLLSGFALLIGHQVVREYSLTRSLVRDGQGYAARSWRRSAAVAYVCQLPDVPIYANDLPAVYFHCGRSVRALPSPQNAASGRSNPSYDSEVEAVRLAVRDHEGIVAFLGWHGETRLERTGFGDVVETLTLVRTFDDGLIYGK